MKDSSLSYPVPIDTKPTLIEAGIGIHGERPETFRHDGYWSLQLCYDAADLTIGDTRLLLSPNSAVIRPPNQALHYEYHVNPWRGCYAHFVSHPLAGDPVDIPALQDAGDNFDRLCASVMDACALQHTSPLQAEVIIWDVLWRVARLTKRVEPHVVWVHPAIARAVDFIDLSMPGPFDLDNLVAAAQVSHTHLNRLFHDELGTSITEHIRKRRAERAKQLLHFTVMPISVVAERVGIPDLQQFNKFVRREFGLSPRAFRKAAYTSRMVKRSDARIIKEWE